MKVENRNKGWGVVKQRIQSESRSLDKAETPAKQEQSRLSPPDPGGNASTPPRKAFKKNVSPGLLQVNRDGEG